MLTAASPFPSRGGFTLAELLAALTILTIGILGLATGSARMMTAARTTESKASAIQAADDRLAMVRISPAYAALDSLFERVEDDLPGLPGCIRTTDVARVLSPGESGRVLDYTRVTVTVGCPGLASPVVRTLVLGAP